MADGRFREDLLYRLNTVEIHLPPLRERREDIPLLAAHFLELHTKKYRKPVTGFSDDATQALLEHRWTGNVRELEHAVERSILLAHGELVGVQDLGLLGPAESDRSMEIMTLQEVEKALIDKALRRHDGNVSQAAEALGLSRSALYRRLERHDL